jgi:cytochrome c5
MLIAILHTEETMSKLGPWFTTLFAFASLLLASVPVSAQALNGKELYRNNCKVCHDKGSAHGQYTPMTYSQDQWRTFFKVKLLSSHKAVIHPKNGGKLLDELTPDQIKAIQRFAIDHAADSEQPATCG